MHGRTPRWVSGAPQTAPSRTQWFHSQFHRREDRCRLRPQNVKLYREQENNGVVAGLIRFSHTARRRFRPPRTRPAFQAIAFFDCVPGLPCGRRALSVAVLAVHAEVAAAGAFPIPKPVGAGVVPVPLPGQQPPDAVRSFRQTTDDPSSGPDPGRWGPLTTSSVFGRCQSRASGAVREFCGTVPAVLRWGRSSAWPSIRLRCIPLVVASSCRTTCRTRLYAGGWMGGPGVGCPNPPLLKSTVADTAEVMEALATQPVCTLVVDPRRLTVADWTDWWFRFRPPDRWWTDTMDQNARQKTRGSLAFIQGVFALFFSLVCLYTGSADATCL